MFSQMCLEYMSVLKPISGLGWDLQFVSVANYDSPAAPFCLMLKCLLGRDWLLNAIGYQFFGQAVCLQIPPTLGYEVSKQILRFRHPLDLVAGAVLERGNNVLIKQVQAKMGPWLP